MTINEYYEKNSAMAMARMGLERFCSYLRQDSREDKYLREEYLAIQSVLRYRGFPSDATIELGNEREEWDARVVDRDETYLFEVVQALPTNEHVIRASVAGGEARVMTHVRASASGRSVKLPITGPVARYLIQFDHAQDQDQFPRVIVEAIKKKHRKRYDEERSLVVAFDGDYSSEEDRIVHEWVNEIQQQTDRGAFKEILLVELARQKTFPVF